MNWKTEIYDNDGCEAIRTEYRVLLGLKLSDKEAERTIMQYCIGQAASGTPEEGRLWLALALTQWSYGRLTPTAKEKALLWLQIDGIVSEGTAHKLKETLLSPQPQRKNFGVPPWAKSCPWPEGGLLAYRICTDTHYQDNNFWGKLVLLRIVEIIQYPITFVAPEAGSIKRMAVALYNWCGNTIPDISIINELEFTPIISYQKAPDFRHFQSAEKSVPASEFRALLNEFVETVEHKIPEYFIQLDWKANSGVFTYLGSDCNFKKPTHDYALNNGAWILSHSNAFDVTLMRRLQELLDAGKLRYNV